MQTPTPRNRRKQPKPESEIVWLSAEEEPSVLCSSEYYEVESPARPQMRGSGYVNVSDTNEGNYGNQD